MSEEQVVDTAPEVTTEETAPAEASNVEQPSFKEWLASNAPEGASTNWLEKYKDDESVAKAVYSAQSMIGKKGDIPSEDAGEEAYKEFWGKLGANDIAPAELPEFGEEYGDFAPELKEYYGGITEKVAELAKEVAPTAKNVPDLMNKVVQQFIAEDAEATRQARVEQQAAMKQQFETTAKKAGLTTDEFQAQIAEVQGKYGWKEDTPFAEVLLTLAKETSNSNTLQEAHLNNTNEGIEMQIAELTASDEYLKDSGPAHDIAVKKVNDLLKRKFELDKLKG